MNRSFFAISVVAKIIFPVSMLHNEIDEYYICNTHTHTHHTHIMLHEYGEHKYELGPYINKENEKFRFGWHISIVFAKGPRIAGSNRPRRRLR